MTSFYKNLERIQDNLYIYQRDGSKRGTWQARARIDGKYIPFSTRTTDRNRAREIALSKCKEYVRRTSKKLKVERKIFSDFADLLIDAANNILGNPRKRNAVLSPLNLHLIPFFGQMDIYEISVSDIAKYKRERLKVRPKPAAQTINKELFVLRKVFKRAVTEHHMVANDIPEIENLSLINEEEYGSDPQKKRLDFDRKEIKKITSRLRQLEARAHAKFQIKMQKRQQYLQNRKNCTYDDAAFQKEKMETYLKSKELQAMSILPIYVDLILGTGARPSTLARMTRQSIKEDEQGRLLLRGLTKKGGKHADVLPRSIIPTDIGEKAIRRLLKYHDNRSATSRKTPLLPITTHHLNRLFCKVLDDLDLREDEIGGSRSIYSLRHTYINQRFRGGVDVQTIASNTLTSVQMIDRYYQNIKNELREELREQDKLLLHDESEYSNLLGELEGENRESFLEDLRFIDAKEQLDFEEGRLLLEDEIELSDEAKEEIAQESIEAMSDEERLEFEAFVTESRDKPSQIF
ncbi:site-specific integrase [Magnetovibrio blakemorei]|uniref:Tyr recombinase domain-containing protein n=1 Tax=Magnetovibrio blakemorei TaxID=28181 RepID=A0A1E5Q3R4_9PROT|nr:site-specific integrase [Magnetovibrio blakemorei]OEJ64078.1 hypothetical protein BEN30_01350 [Magnetovibrio blakemorei]